MIEDDFDILAPKVLAGEANPQERARLEQLLAHDAGLRAEFAQLRAVWTTLNDTAPLIAAMDAPPSPPPPERLRKWQAAVAQISHPESQAATGASQSKPQPLGDKPFAGWLRENIRLSRIALAAACIVLVILTIGLLALRRETRVDAKPAGYLLVGKGTAKVSSLSQRTIPGVIITLRNTDEIDLPEGTSATVLTPNGAISLQGPQRSGVTALLAKPLGSTNATGEIDSSARKVRSAMFETPDRLSGLLATMRSLRSIPVYSPVACTANLTPQVLWKTNPGKSYDIVIADVSAPTTALLRATNVVSPVDFGRVWPGRALTKDSLYRLRISETGQPLISTELTFRTLAYDNRPNPLEPADKLLAAYQILTITPACLGDALTLLLTLPPEISESELALRLKLFVFGQLSYQSDFESTLHHLASKQVRM